MFRPNEVRTPGGLVLPIHTGISGRVRWQVLDERGVPEIPRSPSGLPLGPVEGVEQPNLITDGGLDLVGTQSIRATAPNTSFWRGVLRVGTGSTAPAFTDTALVAEVQNESSEGGESSSIDAGDLDDVNDVFWNEIIVPRAVVMTADRNLTEFGLGSSTVLSVRELFRDGGGNPVTISLLNGKTLLLWHTLRFEMPAPAGGTSSVIAIEEYDATNTLVNTVNVTATHGPVVSDSDPDNGFYLFEMWDPTSTLEWLRYYDAAPNAYSRTGVFYTGQYSDEVSLLAYTSGSHQRTKRRTMTAAEYAGAMYGFYFTSGANVTSQQAAYQAIFTSPTTYTKAGTDTMRFGIISSWARA